MKNFYSFKSTLLGVALTFVSLTAFAQTKTITITTTSIGGATVLGSGSYNNGAERKWTTDGVGFGGKAITANQINNPTTGTAAATLIQAQSNNGVIYNTTALPGKLVSVKINYVGTATNFTLQGGSSERLVNTAAANYNVTGGTAVGAASATGWTADDLKDTNYTYFAIKKSSAVSYITSIEVEYQEAATCSAPVIVNQPTNISAIEGNPAAFTVNATGNNLTYQWQVLDGNNQWTDLNYNTSTTTNTFSIPDTTTDMSGAKFRVVVSSATCTTISDEVTLIVTPGLAVGNTNAAKANLVKNTVVANEIVFGQTAKISIINMNGQVVKTADVTENGVLNVSQLSKGIYIVTATINGKAVSQKIVKK